MKKLTFIIVLLFISCNKINEKNVYEIVVIKEDSYGKGLQETYELYDKSAKVVFTKAAYQFYADSLKYKSTPSHNTKYIMFNVYDYQKNNLSDSLDSEIVKEVIAQAKVFGEEQAILYKEYHTEAVSQPVKITKKSFEKLLSSWNGSLPSLVEYTKKQLDDPSSFDHVETGYVIKDGYTQVRMKFRAKNKFNATVLNTITAAVDNVGNIIRIIDYEY